MYTGNLIADLMTTVDRAGKRAEAHRLEEERELREIFAMQIPMVEDGEIFLGAA